MQVAEQWFYPGGELVVCECASTVLVRSRYFARFLLVCASGVLMVSECCPGAVLVVYWWLTGGVLGLSWNLMCPGGMLFLKRCQC